MPVLRTFSLLQVNSCASARLALFLLEASKDGMDARIVDRDRWIFGRQPQGALGLARPLHVFVHTPDANVFTKDCMQKFATVGTIELYGSPVDVEVCPPKLRREE